MSAHWGGQPRRGCLPSGCLHIGVCPGVGGSLPGGEVLPRGCTPPSVDRMTDACENITFPQLLLRTVIK